MMDGWRNGDWMRRSGFGCSSGMVVLVPLLSSFVDSVVVVVAVVAVVSLFGKSCPFQF